MAEGKMTNHSRVPGVEVLRTWDFSELEAKPQATQDELKYTCFWQSLIPGQDLWAWLVQ